MKSFLVICLVFLLSSISFAASDNAQRRITRIALPNSYTVRLNDGFHDMEFAPGFRDMNFGDPVSKLGPNAKLMGKTSGGKNELYKRDSDKLTIGNIPLKIIVYEFPKNALAVVRLFSDASNLEALKDLVVSKYGVPAVVKEESNKEDRYIWVLGKNLLKIGITRLGAQLCIINLEALFLSQTDTQIDVLYLQPGFLDMRLGDHFDKIKSKAKNISDSKYDVNNYYRPSDKLVIGNGKLKKIEYRFNNNILTMIEVEGDGNSFDELADICIIRYGKPDEAFIVEEGDYKSIRYSWKVNISDILLVKEANKTTLMIYSLPLAKAAAGRNDKG